MAIQTVALALRFGLDVVLKDLQVPSFPCDVQAVQVDIFGLLWRESEFVEKAITARHPLAVEDAVPAQLVDAIQPCSRPISRWPSYERISCTNGRSEPSNSDMMNQS